MTDVELIEAVNSSDKYISCVHTLYNSAFPREERRPWEREMELLDSGMPFFKLWIAIRGGEFAGFATVWQLPGTVYIEHFAVDESLRGAGLGGKILDRLVDMAAEKPVVVEVELPDANAEAPRRIAFYERHGFDAMPDFLYFQPPYSPELSDVQLMLMTTRPLPDTKAFVIMLHTLVYNQ